jgi:hypothetical protein
MGITFAPTFAEILTRVLFSCLAFQARPRTYRVPRIIEWIRARQARTP